MASGSSENNDSSTESKKLSKLRSKIDSTDREIVQLLLDRAKFVKEVGKIKQDTGTTVYRPDREKQVYENINQIVNEISGGKPAMPVEVFEHIYREIMSGSIAIEGGAAVAYLGPEASFSHQATRSKFGASLRLKPERSIEDIFKVVSSGQKAVFGVVPVENTIAGTVGQTFDNLLNTNLKIYAEHFIRVEMNLLNSIEVDLSQVKKIYTLKIVYDQCRQWLSSNINMKDLEIVETSSTAVAACLAAEKKDGVAIASDFAASTYGLKILASGIQDTSYNITRFFVIGNEQCQATGDDKTSIVVTLGDRPGSLFSILKPFEKGKINLTRIESRTTRKSLGEYHFFIDFEGHREDPEISKILNDIKSATTMIKILGSYPRMNFPL